MVVPRKFAAQLLCAAELLEEARAASGTANACFGPPRANTAEACKHCFEGERGKSSRGGVERPREVERRWSSAPPMPVVAGEYVRRPLCRRRRILRRLQNTPPAERKREIFSRARETENRERVFRGSSRASSRDCVSERERVGARKNKQKKELEASGPKILPKLIHRICAPKKATLSLLLPQSTAAGAAPFAVHPPLCSKLY